MKQNVMGTFVRQLVSLVLGVLLIGGVWLAGCAFVHAEDLVIRRNLTMEWDDVPDSLGYQLEVTRILANGKRKTPMFFKTKKPSWQGRVAAGKYEVRLRSRDEREVYGDWSPPIEVWARLPEPEMTAPSVDGILKSKEQDSADVEFKWQPVQGAKRFWLEIQFEGGDKVFSEEIDDVSKVVSLKVARAYLWRVTTVMPEEKKPELDKPLERKFVLMGGALAAPTIDRPDSKFVTELMWSKPKNAGYFKYKLERRENETKWIVLEEKERIDAAVLTLDPTYPGGTLRLSVVAEGDLRQPSSPAVLDFPVYDGLRTPEAIELAKLREAIERETNRLFIASYLISSINYDGKNYETRRAAKFNALSGTGRLGFAYLPKGKSWGFSSIADLGGMLIEEKNHTFYSVEMQAMWRRYIREVIQLRVYGGVFARQLPVAIKQLDNRLKIEDVSALGPHLGVQFWKPFTYRFGVQFNVQVQAAMMGISTPNGQPVQTSLSYQAGLMGSYKFKDNLTGFAGYAYRTDSIAYKAKPYVTGGPVSYATPGELNEIKFQGHYLNLLLEWGF